MGDPESTRAPTDNAADRSIGLDDAYGLETPEDSRKLYRSWASTYESRFMADHGYTYHEGVAAIVAERASNSDGPMLDVGCGTGGVGASLRLVGSWAIDGADISPEMMAVAATKLDRDGAPVYRKFLEVDLTDRLSIDDDYYGTVVSAGLFTHGHVSHDALDELYRISKPGALFVLGVNAEHYEQRGFDTRFRTDVEAARIVEPEIRRTAIYGKAKPDDHEHAGDDALVVVFRTTS